jgi:hypothetical protein
MLVSLIAIIASVRDSSAQLRALTLQGDTVTISDTGAMKTLIVLWNPFNCRACVHDLAEAIHHTDFDTARSNVILLMRSGNDQESRAEDFIMLKRVFPGVKNFLFDIQSGYDQSPRDVKEGIFGMLQVHNTPALYSLTSLKSTYYPYSDLFDSTGLSVAGSAVIWDALR